MKHTGVTSFRRTLSVGDSEFLNPQAANKRYTGLDLDGELGIGVRHFLVMAVMSVLN